MTFKAHANQQSTVTFFPSQLHGEGHRSRAIPELRRVTRHSGQNDIVVRGKGDVNVELRGLAPETEEGTQEVYPGASAALSFPAQAELLSAPPSWGKVSSFAALDEEDEDEDEDPDDDELDEDDDEDLEDEDEDFDDEDLEDDEDDDLDDDDLDDEDEDEDDEE